MFNGGGGYNWKNYQRQLTISHVHEVKTVSI